MQLPPGADGARRRRHPLPRVRAPGPPRPRRPPALGRGSPASPPSGTSSRRRRSCSRSGPGTPTVLQGFAHRRRRHADPGRPGRRGCARPRTSARGCRRAPRCSTPPCPTGSTQDRRPTARRSARSRSELQAAYSMIAPLPDTHFHAAFGHLDGYSSGYYTYMWSLVIAKDLFSAFDRDNLLRRRGGGALPRPDPGPGRVARTPPTWSRTSSAGRSASSRSRPGWRSKSDRASGPAHCRWSSEPRDRGTRSRLGVSTFALHGRPRELGLRGLAH